MRKLLLLFLFCFGFLISGFAQTTIWQESFDPAPQAGWGIDVPFGSNGANHCLWMVNGSEGGMPPNSCCWTAGNNTLHVEIQGGSGAIYNPFISFNSQRKSITPSISTLGYQNMTLSFDYLEGGSGVDNMHLEYSTDGGTTWLPLSDPAKSTDVNCFPAYEWGTHSISLPATCNNIANLKIAFIWENSNVAIGQDLSTAINDIKIEGGLIPISTCNMPVLSLPFNGNANDVSGNNNNGILGGANLPQLTLDRFGNANSAYEFGGCGNMNWIQVPNSSSLQFTNRYSASLWFKQCDFNGMDGWGNCVPNSGFKVLYAKAGDYCAANPAIYCGTSVSATNQLLVTNNNKTYICGGGALPGSYFVDTTKNCFDPCEWIHLVNVVDSNVVRMYFNGQLIKQQYISPPDFTLANSQDFYFGRMFPGNWYPYGGVIDDINIYNCAINQQTIDSLYGGYSNPLQGIAVASALDDSVCLGQNLNLMADTMNNATYTWTGPNGFTSNNQNPIINNFQAINIGDYILEVSISGCGSSFDTIHIAQGPCCTPTLTATNILNYCSNCEPICPNLSITSGLGCGNLDTVQVYFTSGYTIGQDTLQFVPQLGINSTFNASTGVLTLYGNANYGVWETVLQSVCYKSLVANSTNSNATKNIVIVLGDALYNPVTHHFYKLVNNPVSTDWTDAKVKASQSNHFGKQGYLVTLTSAQENNFVNSLFQETVWIGASDSVVEGEWRWVTGCEGLEDNGLGRLFWLGDQTGAPVGGNFTSWYAGNPSNTNLNEDVASFNYPQSEWNDANWSTPYAYIIEYGCMPGDPTINITGNVVVNLLPATDTIINQTICQGQSYLGYQFADTYIDTFASQTGCDSLRILNLEATYCPPCGTIINESFDNVNAMSNWNVSYQYNGGSSIVSDGAINVHVNGGSNGFGGLADMVTLVPNYGGVLSDLTNKEIYYNLKEILLDSIPNQKSNLAAEAMLYNDPNNIVWIKISGNHCGYAPTPANTYNTWSMHYVGLWQVIGGVYSYQVIDTLNFNELYNTDYILYNNGGNWQIKYKRSNSNSYNTIPTSLPQISNTNFSIRFYSADGGFTTQNAQGTWQVNNFVVANVSKDTIINHTICQGQSYLGHTVTNVYVDTFQSVSGCDSLSKLCLLVNQCCLDTTYNLSQNASMLNANTCNLTVDAPSQIGTLTFKNQFNLNQIFDETFQLFFGCNDGGADGISIMLHNQGNVYNGIASDAVGSNLLPSQLKFEFDTYENNAAWSSILGDPWFDHLAIMKDGAKDHNGTGNLFGPVQASNSSANIEDCLNHQIRIRWNPQFDSLLVYFDGVPRISTQYDVVNNIFGGFPFVYLTVAGATGGLGNLQQVSTPLIQSLTLDTIINVVICQGQSYMGYTTTTSWSDTLTASSGCDSIIHYNLTVNPLPNVGSTPVNPAICLGQSVALSGTGANTYTWSGGVSNGIAFSPTNTTTYTVTGTDNNGCSSTATKTVVVNPLPSVTTSVLPNDTVCAGSSITLSGNGANTYTWSGGISNNTPFAISNSNTYTVTGTNANGCSSTASIFINANPLPIVLANGPNTVCAGSSITLFGSGANTYAWSGGVSNNSPFNITNTTTYTVTGTDNNGCTNTTTKMVTVNPLPIVVANGPNSACTGSSITLFGSGANTYTWSGGVVNNSPFTINNTTTYTITGTDANGCSNTASKTVTVNALPTLSVLPVNPTICLNQSINLTAGGASTYAWSPASGLNQTTGTTVTSSPTSTTTYTITGTDANGCSNTISNTVAVNPLPTLSATPSSATLCIGDSVTLNINGASTYTWSPSAGLNQSTGSQVKASPMATTTYTITGTNANGCTNTQTISVTVNPLPVLSISPANPTICFSESITLTANGATSYTWTPNAGLNNTSSPIVIANPTATQIYTVTGTDANGCENTISTTLTVNPLPVLSVLPANPSICVGDAVNMSVNGASTYTWSPSGGLNTIVGNSVQANPTVTTSYQVIGTTSLGCKDSLVNTVTVNPLPILVTSPISTTICQGQSTNLTINGANTYAWTPGGSLNTAQGSSVIASPYLTTTYTIVGTDVNSCTSVAQIFVNVNPSYNHFDTLELCQGMSYTFGSQTITSAGNYIHTFQTGLSCDSTVNLHVKVYEKPVSNFNLADHACVNQPVQIQNNWQSPQASYAWNVGDGILTGNTPSINVIWTIPGTKLVSLEVATKSPCIPELFIDTIQVHQAQANIIVSDADTFFCIYDQIKLQTPNINGYSYMWSPSLYFNSTSYIAEGVVKEPVTVKVYVKDQWGCEAEDSKYLNVQPCCNAYLPNSFTPNGDGLNDVFRIIGEGNYHILDFYVANRWGNIVFRTIDQNVGWDGKIQGVEQSIDTYYYFLKYECANGEKRFIKGDLTLLR